MSALPPATAVPIAPKLVAAAIRRPKGFRFWAKHFASIKDKLSKAITQWGPLYNPLQERIADVVEWCLENNQPLRIITVKPRQKGSSCGFMGVLYWLCQIYANATAIIVGAQYVNVESLWDYLATFARTDQYNWGGDRPKVGKKEINFGNSSKIRQETAGDPDSAVGWDCSFMVLTECALWARDGVANADEMFTHAVNSVGYLPNTAVILESTGRGPAGLFYDKGKNSVWLHEMKADPSRHRGKYVRVFAGWHEFGRLCRIPLDEFEKIALEADLTPREKRLRDRLGLDLEQIKWRRHTIEEDCNGSEEQFDQEHPATWEDAFRATTPSIFSKDGLEVLKAHVDIDHGKWDYGMIHYDERSRGCSWQSADPRNAFWRRIEAPMVGKRYVMGVDFASGKTDAEKGQRGPAKNYDHHRVTILRCGYWDPSGWIKPRIVCHSVWPCQWDPDILEKEIWWAYLLYGRCFLVPERKADDGIIRNLVNKGAHVFAPVMEQDISTGLRETRSSPYYGFVTSGGSAEAVASKRSLVRALIQAIREYDKPGSGLVVDERTLNELLVFIRHKDGTFGAIEGEHDDAVMALAFCLVCQDQSTLYHPSPSDVAWHDPSFIHNYRPQNQGGQGSAWGGSGF
jgi:hypothetical protein